MEKYIDLDSSYIILLHNDDDFIPLDVLSPSDSTPLGSPILFDDYDFD